MISLSLNKKNTMIYETAVMTNAGPPMQQMLVAEHFMREMCHDKTKCFRNTTLRG